MIVVNRPFERPDYRGCCLLTSLCHGVFPLLSPVFAKLTAPMTGAASMLGAGELLNLRVPKTMVVSRDTFDLVTEADTLSRRKW
jgi:hypothetical protein